MRSAKRVIAVTALGLPLLFGAPAMAFADGGHNGDGGKPCHSKKCHGESQSQVQDQDASTEQSNSNVSPIYQWSVGSKGEQNAVNWVDQDNTSSTELNAGAWEFDD
ncbi:hypothetical protein OU415_07035 [Saccharopolyspora sp. WRP15-2]|uniref:Uncharacterized protein n=1 Tax=Saccharopolyspora oryzae TaxID=2997343 RepID=A0ABT4UTY3_9PSEU|nr:hypothetical protein [Saccharopolyspora oryzae]MDA3625183.1 hypothetical protein [Saccharopolyspora oryzae]